MEDKYKESESKKFHLVCSSSRCAVVPNLKLRLRTRDRVVASLAFHGGSAAYIQHEN